MDLIDEENVALAQIGQQSGQITGLFDGRAGGNADVDAHFVGDDACQSGLAQTGRAIEQNVVQRLIAALCRLNVDGEVFLDLFLAVVFAQTPGPQAHLSVVSGGEAGGHDGGFIIL